MTRQDEVNDNVQERLRAVEARQQVFFALMAALIETHPDGAALRKRFAFHYETLHAGWLTRPLAEDWLDAAAALHKALDATFDLPSRASPGTARS